MIDRTHRAATLPIAVLWALGIAGGAVSNALAAAPVGPQSVAIGQTTQAQTVEENMTPLEKARAAVAAYRAQAVYDELTSVFEVRAEQQPGNRNGIVLTGAVSDKAFLSGLIPELLRVNIAPANTIRVLPEKAPLKNLFWALVKSPSILLVRPEFGSILHAPTVDESMRHLGFEVMGTPLRVLARNESGDMRLVQAPDGRIGWTPTDGLFLGTDTSLMAWNRRARVFVSSSEAEIEAEAPEAVASRKSIGLTAPEPVYSKKIRLYEGTVLALDPTLDQIQDAGEEAAASKAVGESLNLRDMRGKGLRLPDGRAARLVSGDLTPLGDFELQAEAFRRETPAKALGAAASHAEKLVGLQMSDADLLRAAFASIDLVLPATLERTAYLGAPLSGGKNFKELRAGDMLFFGEPAGARQGGGKAGTSPSIEAAGLYIGNGRYVGVEARKGGRAEDASSSAPRVVVKKLSAKEREKRHFLWAVRLAPDDLRNPCVLAKRSHPFFQAPPDILKPCRLRNQ